MIYASGLEVLSPEMWADLGIDVVAGLVDAVAGYVPDQEGDTVIADVVSSELTTSGYERALLATRTASWDAGAWKLTTSVMSFGEPESGDDVAGLFLARLVTDDSDSPLIAYIPFDADEPTDGSEFAVTPDASGLLRVTWAP